MLAALLLAPLALGAQSTAPDLSHSAPWLGESFDLRLEGLEAGQPVSVYAANAAASVPTVFGLVELDLTSAVPLVTTLPDPSGNLDLAFQLPAAPGLVEAELHVQAVALSSQAPAGAVLSNAAHLRLLSSRIAIEQHQWLDFSQPPSYRLQLRSAHDLAPAFELPLPNYSTSDRRLELSPDAAFAAYGYRSTIFGGPLGGTLRFEHFFGQVWSSSSLITRGDWVHAPSGDGWFVYGEDPAVGPGWDVFHLPYDPLLPPTPLGIGGEEGPWAPDPSGTSAWIPTAPSAANEPQYALMSLTIGSQLDGRVVAPAGQTVVEWVDLDGSQLLVSSTKPIQGPTEANHRLSWIDVADPGVPLGVADFGKQWTRTSGRLQQTGELLVWGWQVPPGPAILLEGLLVDPGNPSVGSALTAGLFYPADPTVVVDFGALVWIFSACCNLPPDSDGPATLFLLNPVSGSLLPPSGDPIAQLNITSQTGNPIVTMGATEDPLDGQRLVFGTTVLEAAPLSFTPDELIQLSPLLGTQTTLSTDLWANAWIEGISRP